MSGQTEARADGPAQQAVVDLLLALYPAPVAGDKVLAAAAKHGRARKPLNRQAEAAGEVDDLMRRRIVTRGGGLTFRLISEEERLAWDAEG